MRVERADTPALLSFVDNGLDVLAAIERGAYDAVLLDVHMLEMDGLEVARRLVGHPRRPRLIALTASAMDPPGRAPGSPAER